MDVFKTHVGEGKALMINEENFYLATRERNRMSSIVVAWNPSTRSVPNATIRFS